MIYLTNKDLTSDTFQRFITESSVDGEDAVDELELKVVKTVCTYLEGRYDCNAIFGLPWSPTETEEGETAESFYSPANPIVRDEVLADVIAKILMYRLLRRNAARKVTEDVKFDYEEAMKTLEKINSGRIQLGLPIPTDQDGNSTVKTSIWGNASNRNNYI
jgi:hypothetical protein